MAKSTYPQRVFQLPLGHFRAAFHVSTFRLLVELLAGVPVGLMGAGNSGVMSPSGLLPRVLACHGPSALPLPISADMRFAFALLLRGPTINWRSRDA